MAGKSSKKGFSCQDYISVLESLRDDNWINIKLEPNEEEDPEDKIDTIWCYPDGTKKVAQIKFRSKDINHRLIIDSFVKMMRSRSDAEHYEVILIGRCNDKAAKVRDAINNNTYLDINYDGIEIINKNLKKLEVKDEFENEKAIRNEIYIVLNKKFKTAFTAYNSQNVDFDFIDLYRCNLIHMFDYHSITDSKGISRDSFNQVLRPFSELEKLPIDYLVVNGFAMIKEYFLSDAEDNKEEIRYRILGFLDLLDNRNEKFCPENIKTKDLLVNENYWELKSEGSSKLDKNKKGLLVTEGIRLLPDLLNKFKEVESIKKLKDFEALVRQVILEIPIEDLVADGFAMIKEYFLSDVEDDKGKIRYKILELLDRLDKRKYELCPENVEIKDLIVTENKGDLKPEDPSRLATNKEGIVVPGGNFRLVYFLKEIEEVDNNKSLKDFETLVRQVCLKTEYMFLDNGKIINGPIIEVW